jgi:hypothetical protein
VIEQPYSNGIWYDVGNVDGVFVNNWVEGAIDGFFFEISKGAICAGNVFVGCEKGIRVLNSSNVRVYHNTLLNAPASFERNERSAAADHFGWHPRTGPDVGERHGHVFAANLLVADQSYRKPLLRFEQPRSLCGRLTQPQVSELDGNVYLRRGGAQPLIVLSPVAADPCQVELDSLEALRRHQPGFEAHGRYLLDPAGAVFKSPELRNLEPARPLAAASGAPALPPEIRKLLGWPDSAAPSVGAFPSAVSASPRPTGRSTPAGGAPGARGASPRP